MATILSLAINLQTSNADTSELAAVLVPLYDLAQLQS
jgi:hypothetical protein